MSKYPRLPTAFLWPLLASSIATSASTNSPAIETTCDVVLGHYSLLNGMTSDRACVGPVECGAWRWGVTTISCLVERTGESGWCAKPRGLTRKGCGLEEGMECLHNVQNPLSWPPRAWPCPRFVPRAMRLADPKQVNGHHKWFLWPRCCY